MANISKAVFQSNDSDAKSALVMAFEEWKNPYDIRPVGVFGSTATISCGQVTISSENLDLEFTVPFDDDMEADEAEIVIYNLSNDTVKQFNKDDEISITAGYVGDTGVIFQGYITKVKTVYEGADKVTTIRAVDDVKDHKIESLSFAEGTNASSILWRLIELTGMPIAVFEVRRDHTYEDSQTVDGDLMANIKKYATVCGISVYVNKGKIYARYLKDGDNLNFLISADTGLIGSPAEYEEEMTSEVFSEVVNGYELEMLLQHRIYAGAIVNLASKVATGTYRVSRGEHRFSVDEAVTRIKMF